MKHWKSFLITAIVLGVSAKIFLLFLEYHDEKVGLSGWEFSDPVFRILPANDVSLFIFTITYGSLIGFVISQRKNYETILRLGWAYAIILLCRMITLTALPLKEPSDFVYLQDPFLNELIYPSLIKTDLFFSGHTALTIVLFFLSDKKWIFLVLAVILGVLLMIQRVHYSIDILAAYPFAYLSFRLTQYPVKNWLSNIK